MFVVICLAIMISQSSTVLGEEFSLPGCETATVGVNSVSPDDVYSSQCTRTSGRILRCICHDDALKLYSYDESVPRNLIIQYSDRGVLKIKQFSDVSLSKEKIDRESAMLITRLVLGLVLAPILLFIIIIIMFFFKKQKRDKQDGNVL